MFATNEISLVTVTFESRVSAISSMYCVIPKCQTIYLICNRERVLLEKYPVHRYDNLASNFFGSALMVLTHLVAH